MSIQTTINCPDCGGDILIDSMLLLAGSSFKCANDQCGTSIALAPEDISKASAAFNGFEQLRKDSIAQANARNY
jgi:hypothetical protein